MAGEEDISIESSCFDHVDETHSGSGRRRIDVHERGRSVIRGIFVGSNGRTRIIGKLKREPVCDETRKNCGEKRAMGGAWTDGVGVRARIVES